MPVPTLPARWGSGCRWTSSNCEQPAKGLAARLAHQPGQVLRAAAADRGRNDLGYVVAMVGLDVLGQRRDPIGGGLELTRHSCSVCTSPAQRYTLVIGPTICAHAPSLVSITSATRGRAAFSLSVVDVTMTCFRGIPKIVGDSLR